MQPTRSTPSARLFAPSFIPRLLLSPLPSSPPARSLPGRPLARLPPARLRPSTAARPRAATAPSSPNALTRAALAIPQGTFRHRHLGSPTTFKRTLLLTSLSLLDITHPSIPMECPGGARMAAKCGPKSGNGPHFQTAFVARSRGGRYGPDLFHLEPGEVFSLSGNVTFEDRARLVLVGEGGRG